MRADNLIVGLSGQQASVAQVVEEQFGFKSANQWPAVGIMCCFVAVFSAASFLGLRYCKWLSR